MASKLDFTKKTFAVITGASQGIGRTIAIEIGRRLNNSKLLLIARSEKGLCETKKLITNINKTNQVTIRSADLSKLVIKDYDDLLINELRGQSYETAFIVHNAGQIGELNKTTELTDINMWRDYFDLNLFSVTILNTSFLKVLKNVTKNVYVVNITSLCGRVPFKNMAMYGTGKAARELFFKVLAEEEKDLIVLNYSPGPVKTAMVANIIDNVKDDDIRDMFVKMDNILTCEQTVSKLMGIIEVGDYKSGDTIDYFDRI